MRHLHQRALQPAEDRAQIFRVGRAIGLDAEHPRAGDARGDAADRAGGARHAADFAEQLLPSAIQAVPMGATQCVSMSVVRNMPLPAAHCEERGDEAIFRPTGSRELVMQEIASALRSSR